MHVATELVLLFLVVGLEELIQACTINVLDLLDVCQR
jgi:hypothetical protein